MKKLNNAVRLYLHYMSVNVRCAMQYKVSLLLTTLAQLLLSFTTFLTIHFMFMRFHSVAGYTYPDVLLCFSIVLMQFTLAEMFARGFDGFARIVRQGEFDRVLVRPRSLILQVLGARFELSRIGRLFQALIVFVYAVTHCGVAWTAGRVMALLLMIAGGMLLFASLFLLYAALCFVTLEGLEFMNVLTDGGREYGKYPIDVYGERLLKFSTFVVPYALIQVLPLQYLLGRSDNAWLALCPLGVLPFALLCYGLWRAGVARYTSSGS